MTKQEMTEYLKKNRDSFKEYSDKEINYVIAVWKRENEKERITANKEKCPVVYSDDEGRFVEDNDSGELVPIQKIELTF